VRDQMEAAQYGATMGLGVSRVPGLPASRWAAHDMPSSTQKLVSAWNLSGSHWVRLRMTFDVVGCVGHIEVMDSLLPSTDDAGGPHVYPSQDFNDRMRLLGSFIASRPSLYWAVYFLYDPVPVACTQQTNQTDCALFVIEGVLNDFLGNETPILHEFAERAQHGRDLRKKYFGWAYRAIMLTDMPDLGESESEIFESESETSEGESETSESDSESSESEKDGGGFRRPRAVMLTNMPDLGESDNESSESEKDGGGFRRPSRAAKPTDPKAKAPYNTTTGRRKHHSQGNRKVDDRSK